MIFWSAERLPAASQIYREILDSYQDEQFVRADGADDSDAEFEVQVVYDSGRELISDGD